VYLTVDEATAGPLGVGSPEVLVQRAAALKKIRPDSPDVTRAAKRLERAKKTLIKIRQKRNPSSPI